jgi:hypothetical protein
MGGKNNSGKAGFCVHLALSALPPVVLNRFC